MFITYLLISIIVYMFLCAVTYLYSRYYVKQVNQRLITIKYSKLIQPTKVFLISIFGLFIITVLINIFPIISIKDTVINEDNSAYVSLIPNDYNDSDAFEDHYALIDNIDDYDISYNDEGMYVIAFGDDKNIHGNVNDTMESPFAIYSKIVLFDQYDNILWDTQDLSINQYELIYDNHKLDARAIEFLNDGNIAVFGLSIDLDTNIVYQTVVVLDIGGNLIELIDIDISNYGYTLWGVHAFYDIVSTDNGFTVEYDTIFSGSVMIHFNELYEYEWHVINDEGYDGSISQGMAEEVYLDTLVYKDQAYYILNDSTIKKYDVSGHLVWENTYDLFITGFDVFEDEIIILSSRGEEHLVRDNLFKLRDNKKHVLYIDIVSIDVLTGEINDIYSFQYDQIVKGNEIISIFGHYTVKDDVGNYYILTHDIPHYYTDGLDQVYLFIKFDADFKYIGFSTMRIDGIYSTDLEDLLFKTSNYIKDDQLYINGVLVANRAIIDLNDLSFSEDDMRINIGFYNLLLTVRVYTVNVMLYVLLELIFVILPIYYHFSKNDDEEYIDEDLLREKYGSP